MSARYIGLAGLSVEAIRRSHVFTGWQGLSPSWWPPGNSEHGSCISRATRQGQPQRI